MSELARNLANMDAKKRRLVEAALRKKGVDPVLLPIVPRNDAKPAPLALAQEQLWVISRLAPDSITYNEAYRARIDAELEPAAFAAAFDALVARHEVLRTHFAEQEGQPVQIVSDDAAASLTIVDLRRLAGGQEEELHRRTSKLTAEPFDLLRGPLFRATLMQLSDHSWELVLCLHHIISDAASLTNLGRELAALYRSQIEGRPPELPLLEIQYADYARWQREVQMPSVFASQLAYWRERLAGAPTLLEIPSDRPRPAVAGGRGGRVSALLPRELFAAVKSLAASAEATPFMALLAAFGVLLARLSGRRDLLVGTPVGTRGRSELEPLIGFFVNTLPLRIELTPGADTRQLLAAVRETVLGAFANRDVPFVTLVEHLRPERSPGHTPLVQVLFLLQPPPSYIEDVAGLSLALEPIGSGTAKFDLTFTLREMAEGLACEVEYSSELFDPSSIEGLIGRFRCLLEGMVTEPSRPVAHLPILSAAEEAMLAAWGSSAVTLTSETWPTLFAAQVARSPEAIALEGEGRALTYRQLLARCRRLARLLRTRGAGAEIPVGLAFEPGIDMVVGLLAILEAGAAYVPLDPAYPQERLEAMIASTGLPLVITHRHLAARLPLPPAALICLDDEPELADSDLTDPGRIAEVLPQHLAYVIFTSGSTGTPKGAMIEHRSLVNLTLAFVEAFRLGPGERVLAWLPLAFDASVGDLFPALAAGATVVMPPQPPPLGARELAELVESQRITVMESAAVFFQQWVDQLASRGLEPPAGLHTVVTGGDSAELERVRRWLASGGPGRRVLNNYGPTEATVCSASLAVDGAGLAAIRTARLPIGRPLQNVQVHIVDDELQVVPPGVTGEIYLGGSGVGRGYFGRPAATAEKFVPDPFAATPGARLYRSGDLARRLPNGDFEFLGRIDDQVKVRGFRIEPAEIEAALLAHPAVRDAAVKAVGSRAEERRLVAYVVAADGEDLPPAALRSFLGESLPAHLLPSDFVLLTALPLTRTGKIDRRALPDPAAGRPAGTGDPFAPPRDAVEAAIAAAWCEVLGKERVGAFDNFFDLGGTSLQLIKVQSRLSQALGREVPTVELFRHPTVDTLARYLSGESHEKVAVAAPLVAAADSPTARSNDVAVIGMAGRFPGADSVDALWRNLRDGVEGISFFSEAELLAEGVPLEHIRHPDYVPAKGILEQPDHFDAAFFGITPRDAELIDPQHRLFLEAAWNAIEAAGRRPEDCRNIGIFAGVGRDSYFVNNILSNEGLIESAGQVPVFLGNLRDYLATRVSYKLDLTGPAMTVQTACSTSLVAVHQACVSLRNHECEMALAGGVTVSFPQKVGYLYVDGGIFSKDGHCRAFDLRAKGVVPGSGVGVVLLKRLDDALRDGDPIRAVIKGTFINNDGSDKIGFTAPSIRGQSDALRGALTASGVPPATIGLVEAHGTGTLLGDLIEGTVLDEVYGGGAPAPEPEKLAIGSIKTNLGHLDTAAGVAGLIKAVLSLEHRQIPPSLHFEELNPKLDWSRSRLFVNSKLREWAAPAGYPRRAAVSSFGIGGTNAHAILEEAPPPAPIEADDSWQLLPLSAATPAALAEVVDRLTARLAEEPALPLADVAFTLQEGRRALGHRRFAVCRQASELSDALSEPFVLPDGPPPELVFLLPGSGAQHLEMGSGLYRDEKVYRDSFDRCADLLAPHLDGLDLRRLLFAEGEVERAEAAAHLTRTTAAHPAIFAAEVALAKLWQSWGIEPTILFGHSLGEYAAAHLAGILSLEDAALLVAERGKLLDTIPAGAMLSVPLGEAELAPYLGERLSVAAVNLPQMCVVAGPLAAIEDLKMALAEAGIEGQEIPIAFAAHSALVDGVLEAFGRVTAGLCYQPPRIPVISSRSGLPLTAEEAIDPQYWVRQLRDTVRYADGLERLLSTGPTRILLEVGPGRALSALARRHPSFGRGHVIIASMRHRSDDRDDRRVLLEALGQLWQHGRQPSWRAVHPAARRRVVLPTYPFQRKRFWIEGAKGPAAKHLTRIAKKPLPADWLYLPSFTRSGLPRQRPLSGQLLLVTADANLAAAIAGRFDGMLPVAGVAGVAEATDWLRNRSGELRVIVDGRAGDALALLVDTLPALAEQLAAGAAENQPRELILMSCEAQAVFGTERPEEGSAFLPALAAALGRRLPRLRCRSFDVEAEVEAKWLAERLQAELTTAPAEAVAYRLGHRWLACEEPLAAAGEPVSSLAEATSFDGPIVVVDLPGAGGPILPASLAGNPVIVLAFSDAATLAARLEEIHTTGLPAAILCRLPAGAPGVTSSESRAAILAETRYHLAAIAQEADRLGIAPRILLTSLSTELAEIGDLLPALWPALAAPPWRRITLDDAPLEKGQDLPALSPAEQAEALALALATGEPTVIVSAFSLPERRRQRDDPAERAAPVFDATKRHPRPELDNDYTPPRSRDEKVLCEIWADLLGLDRVGIHDNFFDVGGDSVVALQVIARANQQGLKLTQRKTYHNQTIAELAVAAHLDPKVHAKQAPITSTVVATAIQRWFFERQLVEPHHWNFSVLFEIARGLGAEEVGAAVRQIVFTHDALRATFRQDPVEGWVQSFAHPDELEAFRVEDLSGLPESERAAVLETIADRLQRSLHFEKGPLMEWVFFDYGPQHAGRLLFVVHHLVVDAISLRILIGDLADLLSAARRGEALVLPPKTTGLSHFAVRIPEWVRAGHLDDQIPYWLAPEWRAVARLPVDHPGGANTQHSVCSLSSGLNAAETEILLRELPRLLRSEINDVLLTALAHALTAWNGQERVLIDLEGHGREPLLEEIDLSRTVGWFTAPYPLLLPRPRLADDAFAAVQTTRTVLKAVPLGGVGYAMLRYLGQRPEVAAEMAALPQAEVVFLYLGQLDRLTSGDSPVAGATESIGAVRSLENQRLHLIETTARIADGQLQVTWSYSQNLHRQSTIETLAAAFLTALRTLLQLAAPAVHT